MFNRAAALTVLASLLATAPVAQETTFPRITIERTLEVRGGRSHALSWSPDGRWLASGGDRGDVVVYAWPSGERKHQFRASDHWVGNVTFSPDAKRLAVFGRDVSLWSLEDGSLLARRDGGGPKALDWSRDGKFLAWVTHNQGAVLVDASTFETVRAFELADRTAADALALSPDAAKVAVGKRSGTIQIFDTETGRRIETRTQAGWVQDLAWLDDGELVRTSWDGTVWLPGTDPLACGRHVFGLDAQRDGSRFVIRTNEDTLLWAKGEDEVERLAGNGQVALHPDGGLWARVVDDRIVVLEGTTEKSTFPLGHFGRPGAMAITGDGRYVFVQRDQGSPDVFDVASGEAVDATGLPGNGTPFPAPETPDLALWFGPEGRNGTSAVEFWRIDPGQNRLVRRVEFTEPRTRIRGGSPRLSADGRHLGFADNILDLLQPEKSVCLDEILMSEMHPDPAGSRFVGIASVWDSFGGGMSDIYVYDAEGARQAHRDLGAPVYDAAFQPGGGRLLLATTSGLLLVDRALEDLDRWPHRWHRVGWLDDQWIVACQHDGGIFGQHLDEVDPVPLLQLPSRARTFQLTEDRDRILAGLDDRILILKVEEPQ